jgi:hypothetical protein
MDWRRDDTAFEKMLSRKDFDGAGAPPPDSFRMSTADVLNSSVILCG